MGGNDLNEPNRERVRPRSGFIRMPREFRSFGAQGLDGCVSIEWSRFEQRCAHLMVDECTGKCMRFQLVVPVLCPLFTA